MDISRLQIDQSKMLASGVEYFKLFEKHLPTGLDSSKTVLVYEISNLSCIKKMVSLSPEAKHIIVGSKACNRALKMLLPKAIDVKYLEEFDFKETDMKFDCIVMNPPYDGCLHLKILTEAIKHLNDENSICINLSPFEFKDAMIQYRNGKLKKFEDDLCNNIISIDVLDYDVCRNLFNNCKFTNELAIYKCKTHINKKFNLIPYKHNISIYMHIRQSSVFKSMKPFLKKDITNNDKYFVPVIIMREVKDTSAKAYDISSMTVLVDGKDENGIYYKDARKTVPPATYDRPQAGFTMSSKLVAKNLFACFKTTFYKYIVKVTHTRSRYNWDDFPWLGDAINPRTGKKGYEGEWTDDDLYKLFNLTKDEIKTIEETMKAYEAK